MNRLQRSIGMCKVGGPSTAASRRLKSSSYLASYATHEFNARSNSNLKSNARGKAFTLDCSNNNNDRRNMIKRTFATNDNNKNNNKLKTNGNRARKNINVGQGEAQDTRLVKSQGLNPAQQKSAQVQLQSMEQSTSRILHMTPEQIQLHLSNDSSTSIGVALVNEIRVAIHFWSNKWIIHHHPFCTIYPTHVRGLLSPSPLMNDLEQTQKDEHCYGDYGPKQAERLLHWIMEVDKKYPNQQFLKRVLGKHANIVLANIIDAYLLPCTTSSASKWQFAPELAVPNGNGIGIGNKFMDDDGNDNRNINSNNNGNIQMNDFTQFSSSTGSHNVNAAMWAPAITNACGVIDTMDNLMVEYHADMKPDTDSNNAILYAWMKLAILLDLDSSDHSVIQNIQLHQRSGGGRGQTDSEQGSPFSMQMKSRKEVADAMEAKLVQMEESYHSTRKERFRPNVLSYNHVLRALILQGTGESTVERVQWYLRRMEYTEDLALGNLQDSDERNEQLPPTTAFADVISYNLAIHAISSSIDHREVDSAFKLQRAAEADSLLKRAESRYQKNKREEAQPTTITYSNVLKAWANAGKATEAESVLNRMITLSADVSSIDLDVTPNRICFNTVIDAWAKTKGRRKAENALNILERMEEMSKAIDDVDVYPDTITYSTVISAFARSGRRDAGDRAEELLERSLRLYHEGNKDLKPDSMTFCSVLDALSKQSQIDGNEFNSRKSSSERAQDVFDRMKEMHRSGDTSVRPNTVAFNILMGMHAALMQTKSAEKLFEEMCDLHEAGDSHVKPDTISYKSYLYALANSSSQVSMNKALKLLLNIDVGHANPDVGSYIAVLKAFAKKSNRDSNMLKDMEAIIRSMEDRFRSGVSVVRPVSVCYNCYIDALSKCGASDAVTLTTQVIRDMTNLSIEWNSPDLLPDIITYTSAMNVIANSQEENRIDLGEKMLEEMKKRGLKPNRYTYNSFINCLAKSGRQGAAERAEEVLLQMRDLNDPQARPDIYTFASVINCWANSNDGHSAERAERILNLMENRSADGDEHLRPTLFTYGAVLNAWAKSRSKEACQKALKILDRIENKHIQGDESMRPNGPIYNSVINAIAKSESPSKAEEAEAILHRMRKAYADGNLDAKPNTRTLSTILNACAYTDGNEREKMAAFKVSRRVFKEVLGGDSGNPNQIVFATFLKCCTLVPAGSKRDELVKSIFHDCCKRGFVDLKVIVNLRRLLSPTTLQKLLEGTVLARGMVRIEDIPSEWTVNLHNRDVPHRHKRAQPRRNIISGSRRNSDR